MEKEMCKDLHCQFFDTKMELNCSYSDDNSECFKQDNGNVVKPQLCDVLEPFTKDVLLLLAEIDVMRNDIPVTEMLKWPSETLNLMVHVTRAADKVREYFA